MSLKCSLGLLVIAGLGGCRTQSVAAGPEQVGAPVVRAAVVPVVQGPPAAPREPVSELTVVAEGKSVKLVRAVNGPVLLVDVFDRAIYETTPAGVVRPFAPAGTYIAEHVPAYHGVGRIAGVWPAMTIEVVYVARTEMDSQSFSVDMAKATLKPTGRRSVMTAAMPWKDGRTLAYAIPDGDATYLNGKFYVASGAPASVPKVPARARFSGDFVAYATGSVFLTAEISPPGDKDGEDESNVIVYADGIHPTLQKLPAPATGIVRGRAPEETLVHGERFLRRYDGSGWVDVPLPADEDIGLLTVDDDGTAWLAAGKKLYRGALPALAWTDVPLPPDAVVDDIAVTTSRDVWITTNDGKVLHRGPAPSAEPFQLAGSQDEFVGMVTKDQEPHAFSDGCHIGLVVLGSTDDTTEEQARGTVVPDTLDGSVVRGKLGATAVYAYQPNETVTSGTLRRAFPKLKRSFPHAKLVCGRPSDAERL